MKSQKNHQQQTSIFNIVYYFHKDSIQQFLFEKSIHIV